LQKRVKMELKYNNIALARRLAEECLALFSELAQNSPDGFPASAVVAHKEYYQKYRGMGNHIRGWLIENGQLTELPEPPPPFSRDCPSGIYYPEARFTVSFPDSERPIMARLTIHLGPKSAQGFVYTVAYEDGKPVLTGRSNDWMS